MSPALIQLFPLPQSTRAKRPSEASSTHWPWPTFRTRTSRSARQRRWPSPTVTTRASAASRAAAAYFRRLFGRRTYARAKRT